MARNIESVRKARRKWYAKNKDRQIQKQNKRRAEIREWYKDFKSKLQCVVCGENHIACLDFHHRSPTKKDFGVSVAIGGTWSIRRILEEIEKCDVLCANCHRKLHHEERSK